MIFVFMNLVDSTPGVACVTQRVSDQLAERYFPSPRFYGRG